MKKYMALIVLILIGHRAESSEAHFSNSCSDAVQESLANAFTLLHSFEYPETERLFREIADRDPDCAIARWGSAMSIWHPLWAPPSRSGLEAGRRLLDEAAELPMTAREAAYIDAASAFFSSSDPATHVERARAFEERMSRVYAAYLDDPEAAIFYSLALLAAADPRDKTYARQFRSAGLLNWVRETQPEHPGVLHYLIHSYDFPGLAHLALSAALIYADAAPDSAHAQHMPSHIFTRLGMWENSLSSNIDSTRSAAEFTERAHLPGHYDEGLHSMDYLMYAMLQTTRDGEAARLIETLRGIDKTDPENFKVAYTYAAAPARYALERRQWSEAAALALLHPEFPWQDFEWARSIHHFARGIGAARADDVDAAAKELERLESIQAGLPAETLPYWKAEVQVHIDAVRSWIELRRGNERAALAHALAAADLEDSVDKHPVTPGEVLPARELLADMQLEIGQAQAAMASYRTVLASSPNRLNAMIGLAQAADVLGDTGLAEETRHAIRAQTAKGDGRRNNLPAAP